MSQNCSILIIPLNRKGVNPNDFRKAVFYTGKNCPGERMLVRAAAVKYKYYAVTFR